MKRQKTYTAQEALELILNHDVEKNDQEDNAEHNEEEESTDEEDSGSEEEGNNDEVIDPTYRPHATSYSEEAPTWPAAEMEEGYEVEENEEHDIEEESEAEVEVEDCTYYDEEEESTDEEESEEEDPAESEEYFQSKDETLIWSSIPPSDRRRMLTAERAERETSHHGPTTYARSRTDDIKSTFDLFLPKPLEEAVLNMTNKEGRRVYGNKWRKLDRMDLQAYVGILILAGVYRSCKVVYGMLSLSGEAFRYGKQSPVRLPPGTAEVPGFAMAQLMAAV
ncbi:hypothetical protein F2P81_002222 [Scophthalmus maximus]|uniref:PiggyBac transposable element-derived protein domain-containing protein n=1 Tax=Scophthalmus maximus TaxID=52904 RepID=A0A6A4TI87_SCOMX|nr:hypothetical protein F2P81_002222 [Scophthalmus maximus]